MRTDNRGGEPIYYQGPHKLWIIAGGPEITIGFILKFYLYLTMRDRGFLRHAICTCLLLSFVLTPFCTLNQLMKILMRAISNVHAGQATFGPQIPHSWLKK